VDPVPDPLLLGKSGSTGNLTQAPGSIARTSDHRGGLVEVDVNLRPTVSLTWCQAPVTNFLFP
jgi:hypothetical protein